MSVSSQLISWYQFNKRELPWRETKDPYRIWLSEIILQQTRINQGLPYYLKFIEKYPDVRSLALAREEEVMKLWQGLGYYSRARNMHATAQHIYQENQGRFPGRYSELIKLKGIGTYTAAAIASFAFSEAKAVLDGNVFRFLSRYFGIQTAIDSTGGKKQFEALAQELIDHKHPDIYNQAIMEFGSIQCKPQNPDCNICMFRTECIAFKENKVNTLPAKKNKIQIRNRYFNYFLIRAKGGTVLRQRLEKDIWQNLFELPLIETSTEIPEKKLVGSNDWQNLFRKERVKILKISGPVKHVLSHQHLHTRFWEIEISPKWHQKQNNFVFIKDEELMNYALPRLIDSYLQKNY